ncbi:MAG: glycosyl transferase family 2 [Acidobacteria bacterium]|nr:glycosyl transferase family 2 [Acidobacteriota bacterium]
MSDERIIAVIPAFNAARTIEPVVIGALPHVERVIVIDDGSHDASADVAAKAGAVVLKHEVNRGKGGALKTGFAYVLEQGFDGVITLDADGQHLPSEIPKLIAARRETGADIIIGGRAHLFGEMLPRRRMANRFASWAISKGSGARIDDSQSGYRFYSASLLRAITLRSDGFDMESEVLVLAGMRHFRIITIPISLGFVDGIATSHYKPLKDTLRIFRTAMITRFLRRQ